MRRINPLLYQVVVNTPKGGAGHYVTTYHLDQDGEFVGFDYLRLTYTLEDSASTPQDDSFREQLRSLDEAHDAAQVPREQEEERIREMMHQAYGADAQVQINQLTFDL